MLNNMRTITVNESNQLQMLNAGLITADKFINKNYLINISSQEVIPILDEKKSTSYIRLFKVDKLIYDNKENVNDKLISVYSALQNVESTALLIVDSNCTGITFYIGVQSINKASTASKILEKSFRGNFAGSSLTSLKNSEIEKVMSSIVATTKINTARNVSCVTVVPSMRDEDKDKFVQGIEKFIDTMQGENYTLLFVARPVGKQEIEQKKRGYEELYSSLSPFIKTSLAYGENYSKAVTNGMFENFSHSVNNSISNTTGHNSSNSFSQTSGTNQGYNVGGGGFGMSHGTSNSTTNGYSSGTSWSKSVTEGTADTTGTGTNKSDTETIGNTRTLTIEHQNKSVAIMLEKIDENLKRMKACEAFGVWECAGYFIADDIQTSVVAANTYKALMLGDNTDVENSFINVWDITVPQNTSRVLEYLQYGQHPLISISPEYGFESQIVTPGNFISGKEIPLIMGIPHKSVSGLTVSEIAPFGRNVYRQNKSFEDTQIELGKIYHMGEDEDKSVKLDLNSFTSHCFVTGSTGSGKSNTTYCLIEKFIENNIPFLVVEPAKGEYKKAFGGLDKINIFSTNPLVGQMLKLNPFKFNNNIHILEHLDRLIEIFNACWEMYAAMPAILKDAVEKIYTDKGWDLLNSVYLKDGEPVFPTFNDLMVTLPKVINNSSYSSDSKGDYTGALVTRVSSLTNGISGQIFCDCYDIPDKQLFDKNTIVDLSRVGSSETKSLIMGLLVLKLSEHRMATSTEVNSKLKHITVLEEAHNLLKRTTPGTASSNVVGKSVEMICNSIAEMRTYGEGFIIVDQSPTAVDVAAIKNTNTKILMRLPEKSDCEAVGNATGLNENQIRELSKLGKGIAVIMQNNWLESVLTHINKSSDKYEKDIPIVSYEKIKALRGIIIKELFQQYLIDKSLNVDRMRKVIMSVDVSYYKKKEMCWCMDIAMARLDAEKNIDYFCDILLNISGTKCLFDMLEKNIKIDKNEQKYKYSTSSVKEWKKLFMGELKKYVNLPDDCNFNLYKYLVYSKSKHKSSIDYSEIFRMI